MHGAASDNFATWLIAALFLIVGTGLVKTAWGAYQDLRARSWRQVAIEFTATSVEERSYRHGKYFLVELDYAYDVDGAPYSGVYKREFDDEATAEEFAARLHRNRAYARVHPSNPFVSRVLNDEIDSVYSTLPPSLTNW